MKCAHCTNLDIDQHARMFNESYGLCQGFQKIRAMFVSIKKDSDCGQFKQATEAVIEKRRQKWRSK